MCALPICSVVQNFQDGPVGDKGIYSTVQDLYLFDRALRDGRLLKPETLDSTYAGYSDPTKSVFNYGFGWRTYETGNHQVVYHTGWWHGFRNISVRDITSDVHLELRSEERLVGTECFRPCRSRCVPTP